VIRQNQDASKRRRDNDVLRQVHGETSIYCFVSSPVRIALQVVACRSNPMRRYRRKKRALIQW